MLRARDQVAVESTDESTISNQQCEDVAFISLFWIVLPVFTVAYHDQKINRVANSKRPLTLTNDLVFIFFDPEHIFLENESELLSG